MPATLFSHFDDLVKSMRIYASALLNEEIRVLDLLPDKPRAAITTHLRTMVLPNSTVHENAPQNKDLLVTHTPSCELYEALSYTWGKRTDCTISINGVKNVSVTDNLFAALKRLRRENTIRTLWIDAICINQLEVAEKNSQLRLMAKIYERATRVVVWLGEVEFEIPLKYRKANRETQGSYLLGLFDSKFDALGSLDELISLPGPKWWHRFWTVQEFVSMEHVVLTLGAFEMTEDVLLNLINRLHMCSKSKDPETKERSDVYQAWTDRLDLKRQLLSKRTRDQSAKESLVQIFGWVAQMQCADPRDRIYSLLSLIKESEAKRIEPDYAKPVATVFTEATFAVIAASQNLNVLRLISHRGTRLVRLPSWVVDFSENTMLTTQLGWEISNDQNCILPRISKYKSLWPNPHLGFTSASLRDWNSLSVSGYVFDRVGELGHSLLLDVGFRWEKQFEFSHREHVPRTVNLTTCFPLVSPYKKWQTLIAPGANISSRCLPKWLGNNPESRILCRLERLKRIPNFPMVKISDMELPETQDYIIPTPSDSRCFPMEYFLYNGDRDFLGVFKAWTELYRRDMRDGDFSSEWLKTGMMSDFASYFSYVSGSGVFFVTQTGFPGIAPASVRLDDLIVLLPEIELPVIVRQEAQSWTFQGLAFVHGIMEGELWNIIQPNELRLQEFVLK